MKKFYSFFLMLIFSLSHLMGQNKENCHFQALDADLTWIIAEIPNAPCSEPYRCNKIKIVRLGRDSIVNKAIFKIINVYSEFRRNEKGMNGLIRQELDNKIRWIPNKGALSDEILLQDNTQRFHIFDVSKIPYDSLTMDKLIYDIKNKRDYIKPNSMVWINLLDFINRTFTYHSEPKSVEDGHGSRITWMTQGAANYKIIGIKFKNDYIYQSKDFTRYKKRVKTALANTL